jgi:hypothetical protein
MAILVRPCATAQPGGQSKLSPFADGHRILITMAVLLRNHPPLYFFSPLALALRPGRRLRGGLGAGRAAALAAPAARRRAGGHGRDRGALVVLGLVLNAVNAGFREVVALGRRPS